jgi:hypothetical protein
LQDKNNEDVWRVLSTANTAVASAYAPAPADAGGFTFPANSGYGKFKEYSVGPDIPTLFARGKDVYMVNHFEYGQPASM